MSTISGSGGASSSTGPGPPALVSDPRRFGFSAFDEEPKIRRNMARIKTILRERNEPEAAPKVKVVEEAS